MVSALLLMNGHGVSVIVDYADMVSTSSLTTRTTITMLASTANFEHLSMALKERSAQIKKLGSVYISNCNILLIGGFLRAKLRVRGQANLEICNKISLRKRKLCETVLACS